MCRMYKSIDELVGNTPLLELTGIEKKYDLKAHIIVKLESFNPAGSAKDRVAVQMLNDYEKQGMIKKNTVIIEPTSGNTGIGLAAIAAARGYKMVIVMPDTMSKERMLLMKAYGADLILSDGKLGMSGAIKKAEEIHANTPNSIIVGQFVNPSNPKAHYKTTGPEIYEDMKGAVDVFVAGVGTGGTITGTGRFLKEKNPKIEVIAVEPDTSAVLSGEKSGSHRLQGIGAGFIPEVLDTEIYDQVIKIGADEAFEAARTLGKTDGILCGISGGAALAATINICNDSKYDGKNIIVLLPDTGERYLSSGLFE